MKIPYYSQYDDVKEEEWKNRSCAIVCVKMILDYYKYEILIPSIDDLIQEGIEIGGLNENKDWLHERLVQLLRNHGVCAYRQEYKTLSENFTESFLERGIEKIMNQLEKENPIIVSVPKKFEKESSFHVVVLTGFKKGFFGNLKGFYYNDPDYTNGEGESLFVDMKTFKKYWRRMAIFVE